MFELKVVVKGIAFDVVNTRDDDDNRFFTRKQINDIGDYLVNIAGMDITDSIVTPVNELTSKSGNNRYVIKLFADVEGDRLDVHTHHTFFNDEMICQLSDTGMMQGITDEEMAYLPMPFESLRAYLTTTNG